MDHAGAHDEICWSAANAHLTPLTTGVIKPGYEAVLMDVLDGARALARGEQGVVFRRWQSADSTTRALVPVQ